MNKKERELLHLSLFGQPFSNAHTSKADVEATARCFFELHRQGLFPHLGAAPSTAAPGIKIVIPCPQCNQQLRVPAGKLLDINCPTCRHIFRKYTG